MSVVNPDQEEPVAVYYISHHPVVTHEGGKLRVVFNASVKTSSGKSLNDIVRVGPTIQQTLFAIVLRFRQHLYVITADIIKMYRQVNLQAEQRHLQRILWRPSIDGPILDHLLLTVIYGNAAAAFLAIRSLHQAAHNARKSYPAASLIIIRDFYVDDLLTGRDDLDELRALKDKLILVLRSACFELSKWKSNEPTFVEEGAEDFTMIAEEGKEAKTLGLGWTPSRDTFQYRVTAHNTDSRVTKRIVLSTVSQIFDPLGLVVQLSSRLKFSYKNCGNSIWNGMSRCQSTCTRNGPHTSRN
ncbi:uncharacterized protein [Temnothorax nylanderi]|uniref:uncharacterized protein n=1 Tax=Temnothorax nylanderi TaxID=102681 RepID=UPI003A8ACE21